MESFLSQQQNFKLFWLAYLVLMKSLNSWSLVVGEQRMKRSFESHHCSPTGWGRNGQAADPFFRDPYRFYILEEGPLKCHTMTYYTIIYHTIYHIRILMFMWSFGALVMQLHHTPQHRTPPMLFWGPGQTDRPYNWTFQCCSL